MDRSIKTNYTISRQSNDSCYIKIWACFRIGVVGY